MDERLVESRSESASVEALEAPHQPRSWQQLRSELALSGNSPRNLSKLFQLLIDSEQFVALSLFLPKSQENPEALELIASVGTDESIAPSQQIVASVGEREESIIGTDLKGENTKLCYLRVPNWRYGAGILVARLSSELSEEDSTTLESIVELAQLLVEREFVQARVQYQQDRIKILNEINQLISTKAPLERIARMIVRESAYRFSADCALVFLNKGDDELTLGAAFGCKKSAVPETLTPNEGLVGKAIQLGGILSLPELERHRDINIDFLKTLEMRSATCCSLTTRGESYGVIVLGFRRQTWLQLQQNEMFEEFARAAAVALDTSRSREQIKSYTEKLEELVQDRTADLAIQTAKAEEANQAKSQFVANISHELRTPLTAIVGYSSVLAEGVFGELNQKQKDALESVTKSAEHLQELINDVLNISRIQSGKEDAQAEEVELFPLLDQLFKLMIQTAVGKGIQLKPLDIPEEVKKQKLWIDVRHIRQIIINLISNAIKYTEPGGSVEIHAEVVADKAKISIRDTGVGIPDSLKATLFDRFERGDDSYSRKQVGTGLGLSLTKHLISLNGGSIGVDSNEGAGSTFWILIPLAGKEAHQKSTATEGFGEQDTTNLSGLNVLIVDDNKVNCKLLEAIVKKTGGIPHIAFNVPEAKEILKSQPLDAALIDLAMPGENGIDLIEFIKNETREPINSIPLIVVSACAFERDREQALGAGACHFIAKPFRPSEITKTVRHFTAKQAVQAEEL